MIDIIKFIFSGFWVFIGASLLLGLIFDFILKMWNRFWRHWNIRKHGYPPEHCDADGDFKKLK
jgi:hypothetical protein